MSRPGPNPSGLCQCGCGKQTPIASHTRREIGHVKGQHTRYCHGHAGNRSYSARQAALKAAEREASPGPNPGGLCLCGCGQPTHTAPRTKRANGNIKGKPVRYLVGHSSRKPGEPYIVNPETGCWDWQRYRDEKGYGVMAVSGKKTRRAHIVFYERKYGPVPPGKELDHLCRNRGCVNPDHVEPVTHRENVRRAHAQLEQEVVT